MTWRFEAKKRVERLFTSKNKSDESTDDEDGILPIENNKLTTSQPNISLVSIQESPGFLRSGIHSFQCHAASTPTPPPSPAQSNRFVAFMRQNGENEDIDRVLMPPPICPSMKRKRSRSSSEMPIEWETLGITSLAYNEIAAMIAELEATITMPHVPLVPPSMSGFSAPPSSINISNNNNNNFQWTRCVSYKNNPLILTADETLDNLDEQRPFKRARW